MPMIAAGKFQYFISPCITAGSTKSTHRRFRSGRNKSYFFNGWVESSNQFGQFCSSDGLVARAELSRWLAGDAGDPAPRAPADDCDYCPLLVAPALPVAGLPVPPAQPLPQARTALRVQPRLPQRHLIGWAPRGPPVSNAG